MSKKKCTSYINGNYFSSLFLFFFFFWRLNVNWKILNTLKQRQTLLYSYYFYVFFVFFLETIDYDLNCWSIFNWTGWMGIDLLAFLPWALTDVSTASVKRAAAAKRLTDIFTPVSAEHQSIWKINHIKHTQLINQSRNKK